MRIYTPLTGARVRVRDYRREDQAFVLSLWSDAENGRYMSDPPPGKADERYMAAVGKMEDCPDGFYFIVELAETGERIGTCCAFPQDENGVFDDSRQCYDIGYCIDKTRWRQGYATEAVGLLMTWAAAQGAKIMTAEVAKQNAASCGLLKKLGFVPARESSFGKYNTDIRFPSYIYRKALNAEKGAKV